MSLKIAKYDGRNKSNTLRLYMLLNILTLSYSNSGNGRSLGKQFLKLSHYIMTLLLKYTR